MHLTGAGISKAGINPAGDKRPNEAFGAIYEIFCRHRSIPERLQPGNTCAQSRQFEISSIDPFASSFISIRFLVTIAAVRRRETNSRAVYLNTRSPKLIGKPQMITVG
jgi:hypothetical protein